MLVIPPFPGPEKLSRWGDAIPTTSRPIPLPRFRPCGSHPGPRPRSPGRPADPAPPPKKTTCGVCGHSFSCCYDQRPRRVRDRACGDKRVYLSFTVRRVACWRCGGVKTERLDWLANNPFYTQRFAFYVGRRCRDSSVKASAEELRLERSWTCGRRFATPRSSRATPRTP